MVNLTQASNEWASRPADERFWSLEEMLSAARDIRDNSREVECGVAKVRATIGGDGASLAIRGSRGPVSLTHWSMGQLAAFADAPANYLRSLPAPLAAECLNAGLERYNGESVQLCLHNQTLRSLTSKYSRLWNADLISALLPARSAGWMTPPARPSGNDDHRTRPATINDIVPGQDAFGLSVRVGDPIAPAGCYMSDRDMFIFQVNPHRVIDLDGDSLMRGYFLWNSEVGAGAFKVKTFYLENVCGNHIVWGAKGAREIKIVHKGRNFEDFGYRLASELRPMLESNTLAEQGMIGRAKALILGKDREEVVAELYDDRKIGLGKGVIRAAYDCAVEWEHTAHATPNSAWGFVHGLTRYSQTMNNADARHDLDVAGGRILDRA